MGSRHVMPLNFSPQTQSTTGMGNTSTIQTNPMRLLPQPYPKLSYGWSAENSIHWAVVDVGVVVFSMGSFFFGQAVMAYQLDEFGDYAASALAASRLPCYLAGFTFPIFAPN